MEDKHVSYHHQTNPKIVPYFKTASPLVQNERTLFSFFFSFNIKYLSFQHLAYNSLVVFSKIKFLVYQLSSSYMVFLVIIPINHVSRGTWFLETFLKERMESALTYSFLSYSCQISTFWLQKRYEVGELSWGFVKHTPNVWYCKIIQGNSNVRPYQ